MSEMTNFTPSHSDTVETGKTNTVDNIDFLQTIFGDPLNSECTILVSFVGNPAAVHKSSWYGHPRPLSSLPVNANNYFSLGQFMPDDAGKYRRQKSHFQSLHAVMLDDIGTKVERDRLTLPPSWLIETSPGNYQAGYMLKEPITNIKNANQLMDAIITAGLCDPGSSGPATRLARLPVGVNGKHEPPFHCQLAIWAPERRYTVQELVNGLELEIIETDRSKRKKSITALTDDSENESVWIPRPEENAILSTLHHRKLYKSPLGCGKHDITCPWKAEHTDCIDNGTAYFEPDDNWPIGGFKCLHGHCANRNIRDFLQILDVDIKSARMKPTIRIVRGEIHRVVDAAERELSNANHYYQRGGLIVSIFTDPCTHETRIQEISQPALVRALAGVAVWEQFDARAKGWVRIDPPSRHTSILYDSNTYPHLPVIKGLSRQPYLRSDGSLTMKSGYDSATNMFGVFDSSKFSIPDNPTRAEAETALGLLKDLLNEFSFASRVDESAALAAMLTAAIRSSLPHAPMFHVRSHSVGSGKSYLCELIAAFATPQLGTPTTFPADDEECRKLLLAEFLRSPAAITFDNLTSDILPHKSLCTALTSEHMSGRILGVSKTVAVNTRTLFLSSGNNVGPVKDMTRRCITINLNPELEIPAARTYTRPNLIAEVLQDRERYVAAALTIIRAWINAGRPKTECKSFGSYGEWSDLCRHPLLWLGCSDPTTSVFEAIADDPDREMLGRLLTAWKSVFGKTPAMVRDAVKKSTLSGEEYKELEEALHDIAAEHGEINRRKLGWWLKRHEGQIVEGLRFARSSGNTTAEKWRAESVSPVSSLSCGANEGTVNDARDYRRVSTGE